jgi:hypothetical protein
MRWSRQSPSISRRCAAIRPASVQAVRQAQDGHGDPAVPRMPLEDRCRGFAEDRLLDEEHAHHAREPRHQTLRPLIDEMPAQMGEADEGRFFALKKNFNVFG